MTRDLRIRELHATEFHIHAWELPLVMGIVFLVGMGVGL